MSWGCTYLCVCERDGEGCWSWVGDEVVEEMGCGLTVQFNVNQLGTMKG